MNIKEALLEEHTKANTLRITEFIGSDPEKFEELMNLILNDEYRVVQRGSWVVRHCHDKEPSLILPYLEEVISKLRNPSHDAYKRNMLVILSEVDVPDKFIGELADICFDSLENRSEAVAIRAHAISNLYNICFKEPDLANELRLLLEEFMPHESAGFKSKAKKTINNLRKNKLIE